MRCKTDNCKFKIQKAIIAKIVHQDDEENHAIDENDRYLCFYSWKGEHTPREDIQYLHHDIGKRIPGIGQNHSDVRGNLRPEHLFVDL